VALARGVAFAACRAGTARPGSRPVSREAFYPCRIASARENAGLFCPAASFASGPRSRARRVVGLAAEAQGFLGPFPTSSPVEGGASGTSSGGGAAGAFSVSRRRHLAAVARTSKNLGSACSRERVESLGDPKAGGASPLPREQYAGPAHARSSGGVRARPLNPLNSARQGAKPAVPRGQRGAPATSRRGEGVLGETRGGRGST